MRDRHSYLNALSLSLALTLAYPAAADENQDASRLFVEAVQAWDRALNLHAETPEVLEQRLTLVEQVAESLTTIVDEHPGADLAVRLIIGETVGPLSMQAVEAELHRMRAKEGEAECLLTPSAPCLIEHVLSLAESMPADQRSDALYAVTRTQARLGLVDEALATVQGIEYDQEVYPYALLSQPVPLAQAGRVEEAVTTANRITLTNLRAQSLAGVALTLFQSGSNEAAISVIDQATDAAEQIEDPFERIKTLVEIAVAKFEGGMQAEASDLLEQALAEADLVEGGWYRLEAIRQISLARAKMGIFELAIETAQAMDDTYERDIAIKGTAGTAAEAGDMERALTLAADITDLGEKSASLAAVAVAMAESGLPEDSRQTFDEAVTAARQISQDFIRGLALVEVGGSIGQVGQSDEARKLLTEASDLISAGGGALPPMWRAIAGFQLQAGLVDEAISSIKKIDDEGDRIDALMMLAFSLETP